MSEIYRTAIEIDATPEQIFDHFVRPDLLMRWMGDYARLEAVDGGVFSVDINGVLIRGHFVRVDRPRLLEIAWGEAGNQAMPPGATKLRVTFEARAGKTRIEFEHSGLVPAEAAKHAIGWPHFIERLGIAAGCRDPGPDPWKASPPCQERAG